MKIIDNVNSLFGDDLKETIQPGDKLRIAASCFSIYAYEALKDELTNIDEGKIIQENIIFKPEYIRISYLLKLEGYEFSMHSVINLKERSNNLISRSFVI